jgi:hypothetical protein
MFICDVKWISKWQFHFTVRMDVYSTLLTLLRSTMLVPNRKVDWILDNQTIVVMTMKTYLMRSFAEQLLEDGVDKDEIYAALDRLDADEHEYPTGESYSGVIFH